MYINVRRVFKKTILTLALLNLLSFLVYYLTTVSLPGEVSYYVRSYYEEITDVLFPLFAAVSLYIIYSASGIKATVVSTLLYSLTHFIHYFPYYSFAYAFEGAYIDEVFYYSSLAAFIAIGIELIKTVTLFFVILTLTRLAAKRVKLSKKKYTNILESGAMLDFSAPITVGFFAAALAIFLYKLGFELYSTITFIIDVSYSYSIVTTGEVLYIAFRYVFILLLMLIGHFGAFFVKKKLLSDGEEENDLIQNGIKEGEEEKND